MLGHALGQHVVPVCGPEFWHPVERRAISLEDKALDPALIGASVRRAHSVYSSALRLETRFFSGINLSCSSSVCLMFAPQNPSPIHGTSGRKDFVSDSLM
jgi:hypothetical protein